MGFNFRKSISLGKGLRVNLSKSGPSLSFGPKGLRFSVNSKGKASANLGIPGTGVYYNKRIDIWNAVKSIFGMGKPGDKIVEDAAENEEEVKQVKGGNKAQLQEQFFESLRTLHMEADEPVDWNEVIKNQDETTEEGKNVIALAKRVLAGEDEAYLEVVREMDPFGDLTEYGSEFEVGIIEDEFIGVSFNINSEEFIPETVFTELKSGKISEKAMSKTMRNTLKRDYVLSTVFRVARDTFALLPVSRVIVNAEDKTVNPRTGNEEDMVLLSVIFDRASFEKLNFKGIVTSEAIKNFEHTMDFKTMSGFSPVLSLK